MFWRKWIRYGKSDTIWQSLQIFEKKTDGPLRVNFRRISYDNIIDIFQAKRDMASGLTLLISERAMGLNHAA